MLCGGSKAPDNLPAANYSVQTSTSNQCSRLVLTPKGIAEGWKVELMPQPRIMLDLIQLPDMRFLIVNGAQTGVAGYGFVSVYLLFVQNANWAIFCDRAMTALGTAMRRILHLLRLYTIQRRQLGRDSPLPVFLQRLYPECTIQLHLLPQTGALC